MKWSPDEMTPREWEAMTLEWWKGYHEAHGRYPTLRETAACLGISRTWVKVLCDRLVDREIMSHDTYREYRLNEQVAFEELEQCIPTGLKLSEFRAKKAARAAHIEETITGKEGKPPVELTPLEKDICKNLGITEEQFIRAKQTEQSKK